MRRCMMSMAVWFAQWISTIVRDIRCCATEPFSRPAIPRSSGRFLYAGRLGVLGLRAAHGRRRCRSAACGRTLLRCIGASSALRRARGNISLLIRQHDLPAAIQLTPCGRVVARRRILLSIAVRGDAIRPDAHARKGVAHRLGTLLGQLLIVLLAARTVGEAFYRDRALRILLEELRQLFERARGAGLEVGLI